MKKTVRFFTSLVWSIVMTGLSGLTLMFIREAVIHAACRPEGFMFLTGC